MSPNDLKICCLSIDRMELHDTIIRQEAKKYYDAGLWVCAFINDPSSKQRRPAFRYKELNREEMFKKSLNVWLKDPESFVALRMVNITMVDLDNHGSGINGIEAWQQMAEQNNNEGLNNAVCQKSRSGGIHYFFKYTPDLKHGQQNLFKLENETCAIDTRNTDNSFAIVYPTPNYEWVNNILETELTDVPQWVIQWHKRSVVKTIKPKRSVGRPPKNSDSVSIALSCSRRTNMETLQFVLSHLNKSRYDGDYNSWFLFIAAIIKTGQDNGFVNEVVPLIHEYSKKSDRYNREETDMKVNSLIEDDRHDGVDFKSLMMWLKADNESQYEEAMLKRSYWVVKQEFESTHFKVMLPLAYCLEDGEDVHILNVITMMYKNLVYYFRNKNGRTVCTYMAIRH